MLPVLLHMTLTPLAQQLKNSILLFSNVIAPHFPSDCVASLSTVVKMS